MSSAAVRLTVLTALLWIALTSLIRIPRRRLYAGAGALLLLIAGFGSTALKRQDLAEITVFSRDDEKYAAVKTADTLLLLIAGEPDGIGWDAAEWLAEQDVTPDAVCLLTPEQGIPPGADDARYLLLPGTDILINTCRVAWEDGGCVLTLPQGKIRFSAPPLEPAADTVQIYLRKIPVTAGQDTVKCDIIKGTCGIKTKNGKQAVFSVGG